MDSLYSNATVQATYIIRQWWDSQDEIISADDRCRVRDEPDMALYSSAFRLIGVRLTYCQRFPVVYGTLACQSATGYTVFADKEPAKPPSNRGRRR
jgi:hypothetical protein